MTLLKVKSAHYVCNELQRKIEDRMMIMVMIIIIIIMKPSKYFYDNMTKKV